MDVHDKNSNSSEIKSMGVIDGNAADSGGGGGSEGKEEEEEEEEEGDSTFYLGDETAGVFEKYHDLTSYLDSLE